MRRFCGYEQQNDANFQEKGCFLGYEGEFDGNFQEKGHFLGRQGGKTKKVCDMHTIAGRFSAASSASARLSKKVEAAGTPDPSKASGRCAPDRGCLSEAKTGVKIVESSRRKTKQVFFLLCFPTSHTTVHADPHTAVPYLQ